MVFQFGDEKEMSRKRSLRVNLLIATVMKSIALKNKIISFYA